MKELFGRCLTRLVERQTTTELVSAAVWGLVGIFVSPTLASVALSAGFVAMTISLTREWAPKRYSNTLQWAGEVLTLLWWSPTLILTGIYITVSDLFTPKLTLHEIGGIVEDNTEEFEAWYNSLPPEQRQCSF